MSSAKFVIGTRAGVSRDTAVEHRLEYLSSYHPEFELEGGAPSVLLFVEGRLKAAPCVTYALVDLDGEVGVVVDVHPVVDELICLIVHLTDHSYADYTGGLGHPLRA